MPLNFLANLSTSGKVNSLAQLPASLHVKSAHHFWEGIIALCAGPAPLPLLLSAYINLYVATAKEAKGAPLEGA